MPEEMPEINFGYIKQLFDIKCNFSESALYSSDRGRKSCRMKCRMDAVHGHHERRYGSSMPFDGCKAIGAESRRPPDSVQRRCRPDGPGRPARISHRCAKRGLRPAPTGWRGDGGSGKANAADGRERHALDSLRQGGAMAGEDGRVSTRTSTPPFGGKSPVRASTETSE